MSAEHDGGDARFDLARQAIQRRRPEELHRLLQETPELTVATDADGKTLLDACQSYANFAGENPDFWTSVACAEELLQAGAEITAVSWGRALETGSTGMVRLFRARSTEHENLRVLAATGDREGTERSFDVGHELQDAARPAQGEVPTGRGIRWPPDHDDAAIIADACRHACRHGHPKLTRDLLDHAAAHEPALPAILRDLGGTKDAVDFLMEHRADLDLDPSLHMAQTLRRLRLERALDSDDPETFSRLLAEEPALLTREQEAFQVGVLERCAFGNRPAIARALLDAGASVAREPRPPSDATVYAIDYGFPEMIAIVRELWPPKMDLPTAAGLGDLATVRRYFDESGSLLPVAPTKTYPEGGETTDPAAVLLHALGLALMNQRLDVAAFLIDQGADVNGRWGLHEPAGLLHETAFNGRQQAVQFLVERGVDVALRDERYGAFAFTWAEYGCQEAIAGSLRPLTVAADLCAAVEFGAATDVRAHLDQGADPDTTVDFVWAQGVPALFLAVSAGDGDTVELLLARGADATRRDSLGRGALHRLGPGRHGKRIARALIAAGADVRAPSDEGVTPLQHAESQGLGPVVKVLRKAGA